MDETYKARAASFGVAAAEYERGRPSYPDAAVDWMIPAGTRSVVDLGAGTGKFTKSLVERGLMVTAVDPSAGMMAELRASSPDVRALEGTAESIPLPDNSVELATSAQAWHWVDDELGFPEVARVLKPGGSLSLVWNFRANADGWMKELAAIIDDREENVEVESIRRAHPLFVDFEYEVFPWTQTVTREGLLDLVRSRSVFIIASPDERGRVLEGVNQLLDTHASTIGRTSFDLPYRTHAFRGRVKK
jgi:SAM-dependent methyltransferase